LLPTLFERSKTSQEGSEAERKQANIAVYRDQLAELKLDLQNGIVSQVNEEVFAVGVDAGYALTDDTGARMAAHLTASKTACGGETLHSDETGPVAAPNRANGFTGRSFELLTRGSDGSLMLYGRTAAAWDAARTVGWGWNVFNLVLSPGDFNGDGKGDVIARDSAGTLYLYAGDGTGGWKPAQTIGKGWNIFDSIVSPGDFNGDGNNDILAREPGGALYLYPGNGSGGWLARTAVGQGWQVMDTLLTPGDFNGDGKVDVLARDRSGYLYFYGGNGAGGWTRSWLVPEGPACTPPSS